GEAHPGGVFRAWRAPARRLKSDGRSSRRLQLRRHSHDESMKQIEVDVSSSLRPQVVRDEVRDEGSQRGKACAVHDPLPWPESVLASRTDRADAIHNSVLLLRAVSIDCRIIDTKESLNEDSP